MRKTLCIALGAAVALVTAAVALAAVFTAAGVSATTATFSTDKVAPTLHDRTCTGADGKAFTLTNGHYTGAADFTHAGHATSTARSRSTPQTTYSTTDGLGYVEGSFRVKDDRHRLSGRFTATLEGTGKLVGFLTASSRGNHATRARQPERARSSRAPASPAA